MGGLRGIVWLVLIAVAIRGLVPSGFMFAPDAAGGFQIVICTGDGSKLVTLDDGQLLLADPDDVDDTGEPIGRIYTRFDCPE